MRTSEILERANRPLTKMPRFIIIYNPGAENFSAETFDLIQPVKQLAMYRYVVIAIGDDYYSEQLRIELQRDSVIIPSIIESRDLESLLESYCMHRNDECLCITFTPEDADEAARQALQVRYIEQYNDLSLIVELIKDKMPDGTSSVEKPQLLCTSH